ncbi:9202_t:CDS:2, partial [Gigaspora margarita]
MVMVPNPKEADYTQEVKPLKKRNGVVSGTEPAMVGRLHAKIAVQSDKASIASSAKTMAFYGREKEMDRSGIGAAKKNRCNSFGIGEKYKTRVLVGSEPCVCGFKTGSKEVQAHYRLQEAKQNFTKEKEYHHLLMDDIAQRYLGFVFEKKWFYYRELPFGLSQSPWIFAKIIRAMIGNTIEAAGGDYKERFGRLWIGLGRGERQLGPIIDTLAELVIAPEKKISSTIASLKTLLKTPKISARKLASVAGKIQSLARAFAPAHIKNLEFYKLIDTKNRSWNGWPAWKPSRIRTVYVDASITGYSSFEGPLVFQEPIGRLNDNVNDRQQSGTKNSLEHLCGKEYRDFSYTIGSKCIKFGRRVFKSSRFEGLEAKSRNSRPVGESLEQIQYRQICKSLKYEGLERSCKLLLFTIYNNSSCDRSYKRMQSSDCNSCTSLGGSPIVASDYRGYEGRNGSFTTQRDNSTRPFRLHRTLQQQPIEIEGSSDRLVNRCLDWADCLIECSISELYRKRLEKAWRVIIQFVAEVNHMVLPASTSTVMAFVAWLKMSGRASELPGYLASILRAYKIKG